MSSIEKLMQLHQIFDGRRTPISVSVLADRMECSEKTVRRYIESLQNELRAPLLNTPKGWFYDRSKLDDWQVPGLWMTRDESQSLLLLLDMLNRFGNGVLSDEMRSVRTRIDNILAKRGVSRAALEDRIHIVPVGQRVMSDQRLHQILNALIERRRINIRYRDYDQKLTRRTISPQRLVYYRDNWYIAAWCHLRKDLRIFSLARFEFSDVTEETAVDVKPHMLDGYFDSSYGVFAGEPTRTATLRFLPAVATEISRQSWHPSQQGRWEKSDFVLTVPYSESKELLQDVLRHLPNVVVEGPDELHQELNQVLAQALELAKSTEHPYRTSSVRLSK